MYIETFCKIICPNCGKICWICLGDMQDQTVPDIDGFSCWKCKKVFSLDKYDEITDNSFIEKSKRKP